MTLSLCLIVKDEAKFLTDCLRSVEDLADEICLIDTGSTDGTQDIFLNHETTAKKQFKSIDWADDFAAARNESLALAKSDWILVLDADERLTPESKAVVKQLMDMPPTIYQCLIDNEVNGDTIEHYLTRLFPNDPALFFVYPVHEQLVDKSQSFPAERCPGVKIKHLGYNDAVIQSKNKNERNKILLEKVVKSDPENPYFQFQLGQIYTMTGDNASAIRHLDKCLGLVGTETIADYIVTAYQVLISIATQDKQWHIVEALFERGRGQCQHNPNYWVNYGSFLSSQGRLPDAIAAYEKAILLEDRLVYVSDYDAGASNWKAYLGIAQCYIASKDFITAYIYLLEAFKHSQHQRIIEHMRAIEPYLKPYLKKAQTKFTVRV